MRISPSLGLSPGCCSLGCLAVGLLMLLSASSAIAEDKRFFKLRVIDQQSGRGVPLVELETVNDVRYVSDSHGLIALDDPSWFGRRVYFHVRSHGYELPPDGFGFAGRAFDVEAGGEATLEIRALNVAQRLYRVTGGGIYRDSVLLGEPVPIDHPLLNAQVLGSDSVVNTVYQGKIYWFWGDTHRPSYPLGNFHAPGAVSDLPATGGLDPDVGVNLAYFTDDEGFAKEAANMPGKGPTWIDGLVTLTTGGRERMFAAYAKIKPPLDAYARGLARWNDNAQRFEKIADLDMTAANLPGGHPLKHQQGDTQYVYFARPYPLVRVPAEVESFLQPNTYEAFTCLVPGSRLEQPQLDRDADGTLRYGWKRDAPALNWQSQQELLDAGLITADEAFLALRDRETGEPVHAHGGSVYWNAYRQRWVMVFLQIGGTPSFLGELWYAEADQPVGPWVYAAKIASHDRYDFYNPKQHPMFDRDGGRTIYLEGTYTNTFSGNPLKTPRYNYNQIMYKLDLTDPRLVLPVAIYRDPQGQLGDRSQVEPQSSEQLGFFALDRPAPGAVPIYAAAGQLTTAVPEAAPEGLAEVEPRFYALPADASDRPATTAPLFEFIHTETGERYYSIGENAPSADYQRQAEPLGYVWANPLRCVWQIQPDPP